MRLSASHVAVAAVSLSLGAAGTAGAAKLLTGKQIKDGTIEAKDLSAKARKTLSGKTGPAGPAGVGGSAGLGGSQGPAGSPGGAGGAGTNGTPGATGVAGPTLFLGTMTHPVFSVPGSSTNSGSELGALVPVPAGGAFTAKTFSASMVGAPGIGASVTIAFRINQTDTGLKCTIAGNATSCQPAAGTVVVVPGGAMISMQTTATGVPNSAYVAYSFRAEF
jgi:hypothetical protein